MILDRRNVLQAWDAWTALFGMACLAVSVTLALDGQLRWALGFLVVSATFLPRAVGWLMLLGVALLWLVARCHRSDMHFNDWLLAYWPFGAAWLVVIMAYGAFLAWWGDSEIRLEDAASGEISPAERVDRAHQSGSERERRAPAQGDAAPGD